MSNFREMVTLSNINQFISKFNEDCKNNNLKSLLTYIYDPLFLTTISNNSENSWKNFCYITAIDMNDDTKEDIFIDIFFSIDGTKMEKITGNQNTNFNQFYEKYKNMKYKFEEENIEDESNERKRYNDCKFILNSIFVEMLTSEKPNINNIRYYKECSDGIDDFYNKTIELLIEYKEYYTFKNLIGIMSLYTKYLYYFLDENIYPLYFKRLFDCFSLIEIESSLDNIISIDFLYKDYDEYYGLFYLYNRINSYCIANRNKFDLSKENDIFQSNLNKIVSEEQFNEFIEENNEVYSQKRTQQICNLIENIFFHI